MIERIDRQIAIVRSRLHKRDDHHPLCALKSKGACDCYAREDMKAHQALDAIRKIVLDAAARELETPRQSGKE